MVWLSCAPPPWEAVAVGETVRLKKGDPPEISVIEGLIFSDYCFSMFMQYYIGQKASWVVRET